MIVTLVNGKKYRYEKGMMRMLAGLPVEVEIKIIQKQIGRRFKFAVVGEDEKPIVFHTSLYAVAKIS